MQAQRVSRLDRLHVVALVAVAVVSGVVGAGIAEWTDDPRVSQAPRFSTTQGPPSSALRSERSLKADSARYEGQARFYGDLTSLDLDRGRRADVARWQAMADFYRALNEQRR